MAKVIFEMILSLGKEVVAAGNEFVVETGNSQKRARTIRAARAVLTQVARILIMADMVDLYTIVDVIDKVWVQNFFFLTRWYN